MKLIKNNFFLNFSYILICLIPISLVTGPFFPDLFISIISLIYILFFFKEDKYDLFIKIYFLIFFSFFFIIIFSSLISDFIFISLKSSLFYVRFIIFPPAVLFLFKKNKNLINYFLYILLITLFIVVVDSYVQYFFGKNIFGFKPIIIADIDLRITGMFGDDEVLGSYLSKFLPILISFLFLSDFKNKDNISLIFIVLFGLSIFLSSERTSFIHFIIFLILFYSLSKINFNRGIIFFLFITLIFTIISLDSGKKHRMIISTFNSIKSLEFSKYHSDHYKTAYKMFLDKKLTGHGPKSFRYKCSDPKYESGKSSCSTHPHNTYIQLLAETGILAFLIIFIIFLFLSFLIIKIFVDKYLFKKFSYNQPQISIICGLFIYLFPLSPNGNFFNNWLNIIFFLQISTFFLTFQYYSYKKIK